MAVFNAAKREIDIKIVYYGPALCGKTTNVQCIHKMLAPQQRGDLMSLATKDDRTLFFDFLPIELGDVKGFKTRFHVYTVPGQVYYSLTRRAVLTGVDGVVFVADSQKNKLQENIESLKDLNENLKYYKKDITSVPFIIQYNKRDLDSILSIAELNAAMNTMDVPYYAASAIQGTGVVETLTALCKLVLKQMDRASTKKPLKPKAAALPPRVEEPGISAPLQAEQDVDYDEPVIQIFNEQSSAPAKAQEAVTVPPGVGIGIGTGSGLHENLHLPPLEPFRFEEPPLSISTEPEISIDTSYPSDLSEPSVAFREPVPSISGTLTTPASFPGLELEPLPADGGFQIIACGQPQKISDSALKIPVTLRIGQINRECSISVTISFEDFKLRG